MANAERGEAGLVLGDKTYTLRLSNNAQCELEALFGGEPIGEILARLATGGRTVIRASLFAALREHHPKMTLADAGELMDVDAVAVGKALSLAIELAFPEVTGKTENPPTASGGAGTSS
jgi:hypothetical protein